MLVLKLHYKIIGNCVDCFMPSKQLKKVKSNKLKSFNECIW